MARGRGTGKDDMAVSVSPKTGVGGKLRDARERQGVSLQEIALKTRIHPRYLRMLEQEAPPHAFRAPVYARAFLREYATYLRLDPEPLVRAYREAHGDLDPAPLLSARRPVDRQGGRLMAWALAFVSVGVLATLAVLAARDSGELAVLRPAIPLGEAPAPTSPSPPAVRDPAAFRGVWLEVRVRHASSWIRVTKNGEAVIEGVREPGFTRVIRAPRRIEVRMRNAGAVVLLLNGDRIGRLGKFNERAAATFVYRGGEARMLRGG